MKLSEYKRLKKKIDLLQRQRDEAKGALDQLMKELMKDFHCRTIKAAKRLLAKKRVSQKQLVSEYKRQLKSFKRKFHNVLK